MIKYYVCLLIMTGIGAISSLFLKKASESKKIIDLVKNLNLYIGGGGYLIAAILNIWILKFLNYSMVLPLTALTYIWTMVLSNLFLKEKITKKKIEGVVLILIGGVCLVY